MLTFLFWNLNNKPLTEPVARLATAHSVDVLLLAETAHPFTPPAAITRALNEAAVAAGRPATYHYSPSDCRRVQVYTRFAREFSPPVRDDSRFTIRRILLPGTEEMLLAAAHLLSLSGAKEKTLDYEALRFAEAVQQAETECGHSRTIVAGDLNRNPFSAGVVAAKGLHGVMTQRIARQRERTIQGQRYPFLYNPMWSRMGDRTNGPPGTYFYRSADHECFFWNCFDQVLVRPDLLDRWREDDLEILTTDGTVNFLTERDGVPGGSNGSDHLPLLFRLDP